MAVTRVESVSGAGVDRFVMVLRAAAGMADAVPIQSVHGEQTHEGKRPQE